MLGCRIGGRRDGLRQRHARGERASLRGARPDLPRAFVEAQVRERGLGNVVVETADMNVFATDRRFDRVVSVEMFEHMRNWPRLVQRVASWLAPGGTLFVRWPAAEEGHEHSGAHSARLGNRRANTVGYFNVEIATTGT